MNIILFISILILSAGTVAAYDSIGDLIIEKLKSINIRELLAFDVEKLLKGYGYPFEYHEVITEDGYILGVHRIPHGKNEQATSSEAKIKPVVLIMHGLWSSSVDFFVLGPENSLPLMLADLGYDIWLGNNRGTTWSRKHVDLDPDNDKEYWDFSFHELGVYDDPAIIDYILSTTGNIDLSYVGHSQGTTQFFAMASTKPEYNNKINLMSALAPVAFMDHMGNPIVQIVKDFYGLFESVTNYLNFNEILPHTVLESTLLQILCKDSSKYQEVCVTVTFLIAGFDSEQLNRSILPTFLQNFPAGSSVKELKHYLQEVKSGYFRQFDYGQDKNMEVYGQRDPLDYNLADITAPIALYYGQNDFMAAVSDVDRLAEKLPNVVEKHLIGYERFSHGDFLFATDVVSLLYRDVINLINDYHG